jgi:hypothetical protein
MPRRLAQIRRGVAREPHSRELISDIDALRRASPYFTHKGVTSDEDYFRGRRRIVIAAVISQEPPDL